MKPGRELDATIAEQVMGLSLQIMSGMPVYNSGLSKQGFVSVTVVPHYSTDIAAAWLVVEKLNLSVVNWHGSWSAGPTEVEETRGEDDRTIGTISGIRPENACDGDTAPHAICLAALEMFKR